MTTRPPNNEMTTSIDGIRETVSETVKTVNRFAYLVDSIATTFKRSDESEVFKQLPTDKTFE